MSSSSSLKRVAFLALSSSATITLTNTRNRYSDSTAFCDATPPTTHSPQPPPPLTPKLKLAPPPKGAWYKPYSWFKTDLKHFAKYLPPNSTSLENLMTYPSLQRGLKSRSNDEQKLRSLVDEVKEASKDNDREKMAVVAGKISDVAYGKGITADLRQKHLEKYGCATYNFEALQAISDLSQNRGVIEMGAGNGQWSRKLFDMKVDILAFDSMVGVPLNMSLYHARTQPHFDFFHSTIYTADEKVFLKVGKVKDKITGRILLIVFPDPGAMATNTLKNYVDADVKNDTFIYIGEGRGGANGDDELFDILEGGGWRLIKVVELKPFGSKGFEQMFCFRRVRVEVE